MSRFSRVFDPLPAEDMWRDKASRLEGEISELKIKLTNAADSITYWISEGDRIRVQLTKTVTEVRVDAAESLNKYIEAKDHLTALLQSIDGVSLAEVKHGQALSKAWLYHWRQTR